MASWGANLDSKFICFEDGVAPFMLTMNRYPQFLRREFIDGLTQSLGGDSITESTRRSRSRHYYGDRSENTNRNLEDYSSEQLQDFGRLRTAVARAHQMKSEHSEAFNRRLLEILHGYMREKRWTWKHDLQQKEPRAFECATVVMNRLLDGDYFNLHQLTDDERRNTWRREPKHHLRFNLFEHERVGNHNRNLGRYRDSTYQWSKKGLIKYIGELVRDLESSFGGGQRRDITVSVSDLRRRLIEAEQALIMARLKYDVFSKIDIEEHPKYFLACFLNVSESDLLRIFAPNALREAEMRKKAISVYMNKLDPTKSKE